VEQVTRTAQRIADGRLAERVPVKPRGDEIDQLALTFNRMLDRIESLVTGIKEMTDNIAHDLKSPITRIRGQAEVALTSGGAPADLELMAASAVEECDRLLEMINTMLFISRTESGVAQPERQTVDVSALVDDACSLFLALAEEKQITLDWRAPPGIAMTGDTRMVQRMLGNLLDNAIKYTPQGGRVSVDVSRHGEAGVAIAVKDTGEGIRAEDLPHIFERFYRADPSRSLGGSGLGLSFARAVARAHGGDIHVESAPARGSTFTAVFPPTRT
jgi:signal transduction histidine kinase